MQIHKCAQGVASLDAALPDARTDAAPLLPDAGIDAPESIDAALADSSTVDAQDPVDASPPDAAEPDAPAPDAGDPDAATPDAAPDAAPPDAAPPDATPPTGITVFDEGALPAMGATVVSHTATGAVVATATTGADGTVKLQVPVSGMVTVAIGPYEDGFLLWTVRDVVPGMPIRVQAASAAIFPVGTPVGETTISFPGPHDGATLYSVQTRCARRGSETTAPDPVSVTVGADCLENGQLHAVASAKALGVPIAFAFGSAPSGASSLILSPWSALGDVRVTMSNPPPATLIDFNAGVGWPVGLNLPLEPSAAPTATSATFAAPVIVPAGVTMVTYPRARFPMDGAFEPEVTIEVATPLPESDIVVNGAVLPAPIRNITFNTSDAERPRLSWQTDGAISAFTMSVVGFEARDPVTAVKHQ